MMSSYAFLQDNPTPTRNEIRKAMGSNLCRCTGYQSIIHGVVLAAETLGSKAREHDHRRGRQARRRPGRARRGRSNPDRPGRYVDDVALPGMLHAAFVRSPLAHARITSIDTTEARALPGVVAVYTAADLEGLAKPLDFDFQIEGHRPPVHEALARDKVRFVGDPVALIVAETRYLAEMRSNSSRSSTTSSSR